MSKDNIAYGGQAVIGGVLIQSPKGWSLAVRDQKNQLHNYFEARIPLTQRDGIWKQPLIRGVGALADSLYVGYKGISLSDTLYYGEQEEETLFNKITNTLLIVTILSLLIVGPRLLIDLLDLSQANKGFAEGILRGAIVITYIYLVGKTKDAQELFEYHGAEHMTIASFEADKSLQIESDRAFEAGESKDVLIHESAHAYSYLTRNCNTEENTSYRKDAWNYFGGEEKFADALVLYFGGSYNHYRLTGDLTNEENIYLTKFIDTCSES